VAYLALCPLQFAQELLSTFSTSLGEVALQPSTGGTFVVDIAFQPPVSSDADVPQPKVEHRTLWDRKVDGGFPETKELKRRVRDAIEPGRNLGHVDRDHSKPSTKASGNAAPAMDARKQDKGKGIEGQGQGEAHEQGDAPRPEPAPEHKTGTAALQKTPSIPDRTSSREHASRSRQQAADAVECEDCK
jgi:predicted Rdx family selenoprotein